MPTAAGLLATEASGPPAFLSPLVALLVAAAAIGYLCVRLRVVPIVGFLLAGVLIGPNALGVVRDLEVVEAAAEVGVILLLFSIGIEFSLERLARIRRRRSSTRACRSTACTGCTWPTGASCPRRWG